MNGREAIRSNGRSLRRCAQKRQCPSIGSPGGSILGRIQTSATRSIAPDSSPDTFFTITLFYEAHAKGGRLIFIGHSFGGRILEKALAQAIVGQTSAYPRIKVTLPADLTLLINPASEAITAPRLRLALNDWPDTSYHLSHVDA